MFEKILDLLTFTHLVSFPAMLKVCFAVMVVSIITRHILRIAISDGNVSDFLQSWVYTAVGVIGLLYILFVGALGDILFFIVAWFFTVLIGALVEDILVDKGILD